MGKFGYFFYSSASNFLDRIAQRRDFILVLPPGGLDLSRENIRDRTALQEGKRQNSKELEQSRQSKNQPSAAA